MGRQVRGLWRLEHHCGGGGTALPIGSGAARRVKGRRFALEGLKSDEPEPPRRPTAGIAEFDRVTGGGLVPGSALLVGGDPGIGKSTLILQALGKYAQTGGRAIYISGEEALAQVRMRASRLGLSEGTPLMLGAATNVEEHSRHRGELGPVPGIIAIDSIQTLWTGALDAAPGTIAQRCVRPHSILVRYAKGSGCWRCCWSAMSPRTARSRAPRRSSIWSMPCFISKAKSAAIISDVLPGREEPASAPPTRSASSR